MPPKYNVLLNGLNIKENFTWDKIFSFLRVKKTELLDIGILKEITVYYASKNGDWFFWG